MVTIFHGNDESTHEGFQAWRRENSDGFHMTERLAGVFTVHYAQDKRENDAGRGCIHQGGSSNRFREDKGCCYTAARKVCSTRYAALIAWANEHGHVVKNCQHCDTNRFPFPSTTFGDSSSLVSTRSFLLTWNPKKWAWRDLGAALEQLSTSGACFGRWSVGNRADLPVDSRVYLMRLGEPPRGIVGSGWATGEPELGVHWNEARAAAGAQGKSIGVEFDVLQEMPIVAAEELVEPPFDAFSSWTPQSSGVELPDDVAAALELLWTARTASRRGAALEEEPSSRLFEEGAVRRITVNAYERDPRARRACLARHGTSCCVCGVSFAARYGRAFEGFIHVHHLRPISELGEGYQLDPIRDLRPVCPNCHAALHHRRVPYSVEELVELMVQAGSIPRPPDEA